MAITSYKNMFLAVIDRIERVVPTYDELNVFSCNDKGVGEAKDLLQLDTVKPRLFDLKMEVPPQDDRLAGYAPTRYRVLYSLRIIYPRSIKGTIMIGEDCDLINKVLKLDANFPTGVETILPSLEAELSELESESGTKFYLLEIPVEIIYLV